MNYILLQARSFMELDAETEQVKRLLCLIFVIRKIRVLMLSSKM